MWFRLSFVACFFVCDAWAQPLYFTFGDTVKSVVYDVGSISSNGVIVKNFFRPESTSGGHVNSHSDATDIARESVNMLEVIPPCKMRLGENFDVLKLLINGVSVCLRIECVSIDGDEITVRPHMVGNAFIAIPAGLPYRIEVF